MRVHSLVNQPLFTSGYGLSETWSGEIHCALVNSAGMLAGMQGLIWAYYYYAYLLVAAIAQLFDCRRIFLLCAHEKVA